MKNGELKIILKLKQKKIGKIWKLNYQIKSKY